MVQSTQAYVAELSQQQGLGSQVELKHDADAVLCDPAMSRDLAQAAQRAQQVLPWLGC